MTFMNPLHRACQVTPDIQPSLLLPPSKICKSVELTTPKTQCLLLPSLTVLSSLSLQTWHTTPNCH